MESMLCTHLACFIFSVSAKFVFGNDMSMVANPSKEDQEFIDAVSVLIGIFTRLISELPLYKLYDNKLAREFKEATKVKLILLIGSSYLILEHLISR